MRGVALVFEVAVLVWDAAMVGMVVVVSDEENVVVSVIENVLKLVLIVSYSVVVPSDVAVGFCMAALAALLLGVLPGFAIEAFADVNANVLAVVVTASEFPVVTTLRRWLMWMPLRR